jgi:hypothetical protein
MVIRICNDCRKQIINDTTTKILTNGYCKCKKRKEAKYKVKLESGEWYRSGIYNQVRHFKEYHSAIKVAKETNGTVVNCK